MRTLETEIVWTGDGLKDSPVVLNQIKRENDIAIYSRTKQRTGKLEGYEVIRIRQRKGENRTLPNGRRMVSVDREIYPSAKAWGRDGKSVMDLARAEQVMREWLNPTQEDEDIFPEIPPHSFSDDL